MTERISLPPDRLVLLALMVVASVVYGGLIAWASVPPCADLPNHLGIVVAWQHLSTPDHILAECFVPGIFPATNSLIYLYARMLSWFFEMPMVARVLATSFALSLPWSLYGALLMMRRSPWFALLGFPAIVQWPFFIGLLDYFLGCSIMILTLGVTIRHFETPSRRLAASILVLTTLLFLSHVQAVATYAVASTTLLVLHHVTQARPWSKATWLQTLRHALTVWIVPLILGIVWLILLWQQMQGFAEDQGHPLHFSPLNERWHQLLTRGFVPLDNTWNLWLMWVFVIGVVLSAALDRVMVRLRGEESLTQTATARWFFVVFGVVFTLIYAVVPLNLGSYCALNIRMPPMIFILFMVAAAPMRVIQRPLWVRLSVIAPLLLGVVAMAWVLHRSMAKWVDYTDGFLEVIDAAPDQGRLAFAPHQGEEEDGAVRVAIWRHLGHYQTLVNEGLATNTFAISPGRIVRSLVPQMYEEVVRVHMVAKLPSYGCYDAVLTHGPENFAERFPHHYTLLKRRGWWSVYAVKGSCRDAVAGIHQRHAGSMREAYLAQMCPPDMVVRAVAISEHPTGFLSVGTSCAPSSGAASREHVIPWAYETPAPPPRPQLRRCPSRAPRMVGFEARVTDDGIKQLRFQCADDNGDHEVWTMPIGDAGEGDMVAHHCPAGEVMVGVGGYLGPEMRLFSAFCGVP